jgi:hypothetical protein
MFMAGGFDPDLAGDRARFGKLLADLAAGYDRRQSRQRWIAKAASGVSVALMVLLATNAGTALLKWIVAAVVGLMK